MAVSACQARCIGLLAQGATCCLRRYCGFQLVAQSAVPIEVMVLLEGYTAMYTATEKQKTSCSIVPPDGHGCFLYVLTLQGQRGARHMLRIYGILNPYHRGLYSINNSRSTYLLVRHAMLSQPYSSRFVQQPEVRYGL